MIDVKVCGLTDAAALAAAAARRCPLAGLRLLSALAPLAEPGAGRVAGGSRAAGPPQGRRAGRSRRRAARRDPAPGAARCSAAARRRDAGAGRGDQGEDRTARDQGAQDRGPRGSGAGRRLRRGRRHAAVRRQARARRRAAAGRQRRELRLASCCRASRSARPWLLSGGLSADNLEAAVRLSGARAVDVSSGVEARPGHKDPARIRRFLEVAATTRRGLTARPLA